MDNIIIQQLAELAKACEDKDIKPIICGGLGVYLSYCNKENEIQNMLRATQDIDLMLCKDDLLEESKRNSIAEIITDELKYIVQPEKQLHGFKKNNNMELDILVPPIDELTKKNYRLRIVKSILHGHITEEAKYIDEDLNTIQLSNISEEFQNDDIKLYTPSPTNLMIMKLYAFNDRCRGKRHEPDRAMAHAWDVYIIIMLSDITDLKQGQEFIVRHTESEILQKTRNIVEDYFSKSQQLGWQTILSSPNFYPGTSMREKEEQLQQASARIKRWFSI